MVLVQSSPSASPDAAAPAGRDAPHFIRLALRIALIGLVWHGPLASVTAAQVPPPTPAVVAPIPSSMDVTVLTSQHRRLIFSRADITRVAVGDAGIAEAQLISNREMLLLGVTPGRTTLIVWFLNGTIQQYAVNVQRDLALLAATLKHLDPSITIEVAPDRDAVVLTGTVPNIAISQTAEGIVRDYLGASSGRAGIAARPMVQASPVAAPPVADPGAPAGPEAAGTPAAPVAAPTASVQLAAPVAPTSAVINLLQLATLPSLPEEKVREAIQSIGGGRVTIRRVMSGRIRDDAKDTFVLEGTVATQVALARVLQLASQILTDRPTMDDLRVVADEAGALSPPRTQTGGAGNGSALSLGTAGLTQGGGSASGANTRALTNEVSRNIGRAKAIELAGGRVLSFIDVVDLPQVRVDIRLFEVSRSRLRSYTPESLLALSTKALPPLAAAIGSNNTLEGNAAQQIFGFLGGQSVSNTQLVSRHAAIDATLSLLEREGIARRLSSPSLTVLSGEPAVFRVGGDVPVPVAFAPAIGGTASGAAPGVFNAVEFVSFGIQLDVRPLVDETDMITLDLRPRIVSPSTDLTAAIRDATSSSQTAPSFETRGLQTSARLQDGQSLVIGGLLSSTSSENTQATPGLGSIPGLGWLFRGFDRNDQSTELVIVVSPSIVREPVPTVTLWEFPSMNETLRSLGRAAVGQ